MLRHFSKVIAVAGILAIISIGLGQEQPKQKQVKDQAEYDIYQAVIKETDQSKKVQLLNTWRQKYPNSEFKEDIPVMLIEAYRQLGQGENMVKSAQELLAMNPKATPALYWITLLTISTNNTSPERLDLGEKAARGLLAYVETDLSTDKKPAAVSDADFAKQRNALIANAKKTLGWIEWQRKNYEKAEQEFIEYLKVEPNDGMVSYWLGTVMVAQKKPEKQVPALYHFARAGNYSGPNALPPDARKKIAEFFERNYTNFRGKKDGMAEIIAMALKNPFPPEGFTIKSAQQEIIEQEEELKKTNPQLALWLGLKKELLGPNGPAYFESSLKGAALPKLKGKVINQTPARRPKEITLGLASADTEEIKLVLETPLANAAEPGTEIEFEGAVAQSFTQEPFMLTATIEKEQITGWPAPPRATPKGGAKGTKKK